MEIMSITGIRFTFRGCPTFHFVIWSGWGTQRYILSILKLLTTPKQTAIKVKLFIDPQGGFLCFKWNRNRDFVWQSNICSIRILMYQFMRCLWSNRTSLVVLARYVDEGSVWTRMRFLTTILSWLGAKWESRLDTEEPIIIPSCLRFYVLARTMISLRLMYMAQRELNAKKCVFGLLLFYPQ